MHTARTSTCLAMLGGRVGNWIEGMSSSVAKRSPLGLVYVRTAATAPPGGLTATRTHGQVGSVSTGPDTDTVVPIGPELGDNRRAEVGSGMLVVVGVLVAVGAGLLIRAGCCRRRGA